MTRARQSSHTGRREIFSNGALQRRQAEGKTTANKPSTSADQACVNKVPAGRLLSGRSCPWARISSLLLGFFLIWTTERALADPRWRLIIAIGFCGSYTTFSSYAFESFAYFEQGHWLLFATNVATNNLLCLAAVIAGAALARGL